MGQSGSINENRSLILGNWAQTQVGSNIFFNKVTNQQIQRYEVVINDKNQLSSYASRMQDQSGLICRLIYFHPKSLPKEDKLKKQYVKTHPSENTTNNRPKSMISEQISQNCVQPPLKSNQSAHQQDVNPKIFCIYTDRMIPIKQWNKDKIIDVITAFKKLTKIYGMFKVRERCICENQRKEVKIWINQNPLSNFPVEKVESQEDMIADFAANLVSKKEKIAKQLLDIQYFDQAIQHFSKLTDYDQKKYINSSSSSNTASHRQSNTPMIPKQIMDKNNPFFPLSSEVNNFYNVYINTDNSYTVSSSMQNSKFNIINQGNFSYSNFPQPSSEKQTLYKNQQIEKQSISVSQKTNKTPNEFSINRQYSVPNFIQVHNKPTHSQTPGFASLSKVHEFSQQHKMKSVNQREEKQNPNQISINKMIKQNKMKANLPSVDLNQTKQEQNYGLNNTSIMIHTSQKSAELHQNLLKSQKSHIEFQTMNRQIMGHLQKKSMNVNAYPSPNSIHSNDPLRFIPSTSNDLKNRSKNNSSGDIQLKKSLQPEQALTNQSFIHSQKKDSTENNALKNNDKKFFSGGNKISASQNYLKTQTPSVYNLQKVSQFQQKSIDQVRFSEGQTLKYQQKNQINNKQDIDQNNLSYGLVSESKLFVKSGLPNEANRVPTKYDLNRNIVSQNSTLKPPNLLDYNLQNTSQFNKKSFPKYFQQKQTTKSIQKYYQKSFQQRQKSIILRSKNDHQKSSKKIDKGFGQQKFLYKPSQGKFILKEDFVDFKEKQESKKQIIFSTQKFSNSNEGFIRCPTEAYEPRRKFPSTVQSKSSKINHKKSLQEKQIKKNNFGIQVDSQQSYVQSFEVTKQSFLNVSQLGQEKILKKSNNTCVDKKSQKSKMIGNSYFTNLNTNNSLLVSNKQNSKNKNFQSDIKKRKQFQSIDKTEEQKLMCQMDRINQDENLKNNNFRQFKVQSFDISSNENFIPYQKGKQNPVMIDDVNRKQTFPHYQQHSQNIRKNQKQFTFFNPSQKSGLIHIEEINPFEPAHQINRMNVFKKQSIKSSDEKQTLPRTTADQKEKRMFKATRTSEILIDTNDLHSSDPGYRIQQIVQTLEKEKERIMMSNDTMSMIQQKLVNRQHQKFKKWQPSVNIYGSLINPVPQGSSMRRKDYTSKSQKNKNNQQSQKQKQNETPKDQEQQICPDMTSSDNLQTKKKIRKQVFMDYKGLFGDDNPFLKQETAQEKQKAKKMQIKKLRQEEERLLENASSKDLLIQQKVQKQKQKHAQLKSDLSKLFSDEF